MLLPWYHKTEIKKVFVVLLSLFFVYFNFRMIWGFLLRSIPKTGFNKIRLAMVCAFKLNITSTYVLQLMCVLPLYHRLYQNRHIPVMISTKNKSVSLNSKLHSFDCVMFSAEYIKVCRDKGLPYATPSFKVQCKLVWKYNEGRRFVVSEHSGYWVTHCCSRETNLGWPQDRAIVCSVLVAALLAFFLRWHIHCQFWQFITTTYFNWEY